MAEPRPPEPPPRRAAAATVQVATLGISALSQLWLLHLVSERLGPQGLGAWQTLFLAFSLAQLLRLGQSQGVIRTLAAQWRSPHWEQAWASTARIQWLVGAAVAGACLLGAAVVPLAISTERPQAVQSGLLLFAVLSAVRYRIALPPLAAYAVDRPLVMAIQESAIAAGRPLLAAVALLIWPHLLTIPVIYVVVEFIALAIGNLSAGRDLRPRRRARPERGLLRQTFTFGLHNGIISLASQANGYLQPLLIGALLDVHALTVYACGMALPFLAARVGFIPIDVLYPRLLAWRRDQTSSRLLPPDLLRAATLVVVSLVLMLLGLAFAHRPFVTLWIGSEFIAPPAFAWATGAYAVTVVINHGLLAIARAERQRFRFITLLSIAQAVSVAALTPVAAITGGLAGALWMVVALQVAWGCGCLTVLFRHRSGEGGSDAAARSPLGHTGRSNGP